jgi:hypothetical protein
MNSYWLLKRLGRIFTIGLWSVKEARQEGVDYIPMAQEGLPWRGFVNTITKFRFLCKQGICWLAEQLLAYQNSLFPGIDYGT